MGTSAFDAAWDGPGPTKPKKQKAPAANTSAFDAAWGGQAETPVAQHGSSGSWGDEDATALSSSSGVSNVARSVLQGATMGAGNKIVAAGNAAMDKAHGLPFKQSYDERLASERAASRQFGERHPILNPAIELAGGIGGIVASGGMSAPTELAHVGRLARIGKAAATGLDLGAASGFVNADGDFASHVKGAMLGGGMGAAGGAVLAPVAEGIGYLAGKTPLPRLASSAAQGIADRLPAGSRVQRALQSASSALGPRGKAASEIGQRMHMDEQSGFQAPAAAPGVPSLALDKAGPNVEGLAENVATRPGAGRAVISNALSSRQAQMRPSVTNALEQATGVKSDAGMQPMRDAIDQRSAEAARLYDAAREATKGQPVESETLDAVMKTPVGKLAHRWAVMQKANRGSPLPTVETPPEAPPGFSPEQWEGMRARMQERGMPLPPGGTKEVPDPETLHFMKQRLAQIAKMGVHDGAQGAVATQAQGALTSWGNIRDELPDIWRHADDAFAEKSRLIDMMNQGRNVFRTSSNPVGRPGKAINTSLDAFGQRVQAAPAEHQQAAQTGAGMGAHALWNRAGRSVQAPGRVFDFAAPKRAQQMSHAFTTPEAGSEFQNTIAGWDRAAAQTQRLTGNSRTASRAAEEASRDHGMSSAVGQLFSGHPIGAARSLAGGMNSEATSQARQRLDQEIATILTSPDVRALPAAQRTALFRQRIHDLLSRGPGMMAVQQENNP